MTDQYRPAYSWYVVVVLMIAYVCSFVDRQILALMVAPIRRDLEISDTQMSLLMGLSFALFYSILGLPIGRWADRSSRRKIMAWGIALWSVMTALSGGARHYWHLFLARVGVGVGEAALSPPAYSMIADYFPRERLGTAISVYSLGIYLGSGIAMMVGGWITGQLAGEASLMVPILGAVRPWQLVFIVIGLPGLLIALWVATLREPVRGAMSGGTSTTPVSVAEVTRWVRTHRGAFLGHNLGFAMISLVNYGWAYWVPTWLQRAHQWTPQQVGLNYGLWTATFGVAGVVAGGWLGDRLARRGFTDAKLRVGLFGLSFELVTGLILFLSPTSLVAWTLVPTTFFASFGFGAAAAAIQEISPVPMRGQTSAIYLFVINLIGQALGPFLVAFFTDSVFQDDLMIGRSLIVVTTSGLILAAAILLLGLKPFRRAAQACRDWQPETEPAHGPT